MMLVPCFVLGMLLSFLSVCCFFSLSFAYLCMIVFQCGFLLLGLSFGHTAVFLVSYSSVVHFVSPIKSMRFHCDYGNLFCFGGAVLSLLMSFFIQNSFHVLIQMNGCNLVVYLPRRNVIHCCSCASLLSFVLLVHLLFFSEHFDDWSFGHTLLSNLNNDLGDIEMEQEYGDKKFQKSGDEKHWPKDFGDLKM